MEGNAKKTGTTTVGIICKDGIVLAADKKITAGNFIPDKSFEKIILINDYTAVTVAGAVSDIQLLIKFVKAELNLKEFRTNKNPTIKEEANLISGMVYSKIRSYVPGIAHFIVAGVDKEGFQLYDVSPDGTIVVKKRFVSSGSGCVMAYGVLDTLYKENITIEEGKNLAIKAINAAIQRDTASGEGLDIVTVTEKGAKKVLTKTLNTKIEE